MKYYVITSESNEGFYFLVNNSRKYKKIWSNYFDINKTTFKTIAAAKGSLTKLLKVFPEYRDDILKIECHDTERFPNFESYQKDYQF